MLRWDFNKKVGELKIKNYAKKEITLNLYQGNALLIACWENETQYQVIWFFSDAEHMRRCLGLEKGELEICDNIFSEEPWEVLTFNEKMDNKDMIIIIKAVLKAFPYCKIHIESNALHREEGSEEDENKMV